MQWFNQPAVWRVKDDAVELVTDDRTDFWRETFYGFIRDNGHFYYEEADHDFTAEAKVEGHYQHLYDQAGLMVRLNESQWIKAGVEFTDGEPHLSCVVTHEKSDWSLLPLPAPPSELYLRVTRKSDAILFQYSFDADTYHLLRLTHFPPAPIVQVGVMACSPERAGFEATFRNFRVGPPMGKLHA